MIIIIVATNAACTDYQTLCGCSVKISFLFDFQFRSVEETTNAMAFDGIMLQVLSRAQKVMGSSPTRDSSCFSENDCLGICVVLCCILFLASLWS